MSDGLKVSTEQLPPKDERDAAVKSLEDKCRAIVNLAHAVSDAHSAMLHADNDLRAAIYSRAAADDEVNAAIVASRETAVRFGQLEADLYALKDEIEEDLKVCNRDRRWGIYVSHTAEGLPIRVSKSLRTNLWGN